MCAHFFEELLFRDLIHGIFIKHLSLGIRIFVSAVLLALLYQNLKWGIFTFLFGLLLGIIVYRLLLYVANGAIFNNVLAQATAFLADGGTKMLRNY